MGANDGQFRKVAMQAFNIGKSPGLNVENDRLRLVLDDVIPEIFVRTSQANRENRKMGAQSAGKRVSDGRIFFEKNNTLSHTTPVFLTVVNYERQRWTRAAGWLGDYSTDVYYLNLRVARKIYRRPGAFSASGSNGSA